jgi:hypothetical protein
MPFKFDELNWLAVLVAGLATFFLGGMWYTALFGKLWIALAGYSEEKVRELKARTPPAVFFGGMVVCYLVVAFVVAVLVTSLGLTTPVAGAALGVLLWLAVAAVGMTAHLAGDKSIGMYLIDMSFQLIFLLLMGAVLAAWR